MPATTPIYGLPYQVGTDPPCFGPGTGCTNLESVWCDFAGLVETQLDQNDAIIGRTGTAIPMARVRMVAQAVPNGGTTAMSEMEARGYLPFDIVAFDTDSMASLPRGITPRRNGVYHIDTNMVVNGDPVEIGFELEFELVIGSFSVSTGVATLAAIIPPGTSNVYRASTLYSFSSTAPVPKTIFVAIKNTFPAAATELLSASLTVYWHSDL